MVPILTVGKLSFIPGEDLRTKYPKAFLGPQENMGGGVPSVPVVALIEEPPTERRKHSDISAIVLTADGHLWKVFQSAGRFVLEST